MKTPIHCLGYIVCALVAVTLALGAIGSDLDWPEVTQSAKPWSRWWWLGSIGTKQDFTAEMQKYVSAGLGGLEITPIYGVRGEEKRFNTYLSPAWMELLDHVLDEGQRLGLGIDMATGNGWPFGGPWITPETACRTFVPKTYTLKGGERLADPISITQDPVVRVAGPRRASINELKDPVAANSDLQDLALDQVRFPRALPLQTLMAYSDRGEIVGLTEKVGPDGRLDWTAPAGNWTLYAIFLGWHGKQVERAGPGGEGDVIDHFSATALGKFLARFDQAYAGHKANRLRAYFNDSYELDDAQGESNWTPRFFAEFMRRRGYDLREQLPALLGKASEEINSRVISDHRETISDLLLDEFTLPWSKWAEGHGALTRDQAHGSPANILDLYAASGIPETEGSSIVDMKFGLVRRAPHRQEAGLLGDGDVAGRALAVDARRRQAAPGSHVSSGREPQLLPRYGVLATGRTLAGFHFYAAVEFDPSNSFWADFPLLNALRNPRAIVPCRAAGRPTTCCFTTRSMTPGRYEATARCRTSAAGGPRGGGPGRDTAQALLTAGYTFDYVSDRLLAKMQCEGGALRSSGNSWQVVLVPETKYMPPATMNRLFALAGQGATILFHKRLPADVPGFGRLMDRRLEFQARLDAFKKARTTAEGLTVLYWIAAAWPLVRILENCSSSAACWCEVLVDQGLAFERRSMERGQVYFLHNRSSAGFTGWIPLATPAQAAAVFDAMSGVRCGRS